MASGIELDFGTRAVAGVEVRRVFGGDEASSQHPARLCAGFAEPPAGPVHLTAAEMDPGTLRWNKQTPCVNMMKGVHRQFRNRLVDDELVHQRR